MTSRSEIEQLMQSAGAVLVRRSKHLIWRLPNGRMMTTSCTPSHPCIFKIKSTLRRRMQ
jgi:hypothetical protein